jgi:hypothetical protein
MHILLHFAFLLAGTILEGPPRAIQRCLLRIRRRSGKLPHAYELPLMSRPNGSLVTVQLDRHQRRRHRGSTQQPATISVVGSRSMDGDEV